MSSVLLLLCIYITNSVAIDCNSNTACGPCTNLSGNDECILDCVDGKDDCKGNTLTCTNGFPCVASCLGFDSCFEGTLNAQQATSLTLNCGETGTIDNQGDCWELTVNAQLATNVTINCIGINRDSCKLMNVKCGTGICHIECEGDSCADVTVDASLSTEYICTGGSSCNNVGITTSNPTTPPPTNNPITDKPTTSQPTTANPTTLQPTSNPTKNPTTIQPTVNPSNYPTTSTPTTLEPTTTFPTSSRPTTSEPSTATPTTLIPTTATPTTAIPTTSRPTTATPTTATPTTLTPTTATPSTATPTKISTECADAYNAMLFVAFDYQNQYDVSFNVIQNILSNISNEFVTKIMSNVSNDCIIKNYGENMDISDDSSNAIINISMCLNCTKSMGKDIFNENKLQTDFLIIFKEETNILTVIDNSTNIRVDVIDPNKQKTTEIMQHDTTINKELINDTDNDLFGKIIYILIGLSSTCIVGICCIIIICKIQNNKKPIKNEMEVNKTNIYSERESKSKMKTGEIKLTKPRDSKSALIATDKKQMQQSFDVICNDETPISNDRNINMSDDEFIIEDDVISTPNDNNFDVNVIDKGPGSIDYDEINKMRETEDDQVGNIDFDDQIIGNDEEETIQ